MKKTRLSHRILAMVLVVLMTVQILPLNVFAKFGDLQAWDPGVDLSTLKQEDAINWPIKVYDYLSDGMLFEWMDTNTTTSSSSPNLTVGNTDGSSQVSQYGGGYKPPITALGIDFTYDKSNAYSSTTYSPQYGFSSQGWGTAYKLTKKLADDYKSPMYLRIEDGSSSGRNLMITRFAANQSTAANIRYMTLIYRSKGLGDDTIQLRFTNETSSFTGVQNGTITLKETPTEWTYQIIDLYSLIGSKTDIRYIWFTCYNLTNATGLPSSSYAGMDSGDFLDLAFIGYFNNTTEANNYATEALKFVAQPGEYLGQSATFTATHSYVKLPSKADYLTNIFTLNYCWKKENTSPKVFDSESNSLGVRYGLDFTTHSVDNGWKTNAYTSDTFWTWSNGTTLSLKNTINNVTKTESVSMSNINVTQHTQTNGAQFVRLTNNGLSKILLANFREDHQKVQEGYVPLTADVEYMVLVYRANGLETTDRFGLWAHGYLDSSSPDSHKTANYWKYAGLTTNEDWTRAGNVNQISFNGGSGWQYMLVPISETIGRGDQNMIDIDRLANLGMYLPALTDGKSLDIAYVGFFKNNPDASDGLQYETALAFGQNAVNYMNASATVVQDRNESKTYANTRTWHGGGNKSFGMLYSSGGGKYLPTSNSGGAATGATVYEYGYAFDTWMIGYRTNAQAGDAFNSARYQLVYNESTGKYEKVKYTAKYTPTGTSSGHANSLFNASATGTTNNIFFIAATEEDTTWGSNDGNDANGKDFNTNNVPFDGYNILETITSGVMTAGLLEGSLQTVVVNGVKYRVPVYRQETVEYIAYNLLYGLRVPMKDANGNYNTRYIKGTESTKFGGVDLNGDGQIGWINYDGDSRNGNETNEASVDLATALRHELGMTPRPGNSVNTTLDANGNITAAHSDYEGKMGSYQETLKKSQMLFGEFSNCRNAIDTAMDAAYYLLNNIFISNSYNQEQDDYDYLTLSSAQVNALGHSGYAYVFDAGFTTGKTGTYGATFTDDGTNKSAIAYSPYGSTNGTGTISMEGVTGKTRFDYGISGISWTTRFPFLPITDAEGDFAGQTKSYYFLDDAQRVYTEGSNTYKNRNFNYVLASNGEFVYREEDDLFFEFEGDDDVYLFINGELVLDIGGAHSITSVYIDVNDYVNAAAAALATLSQYGYHKDMSIDQFDEWISAAQLQYLNSSFEPTGESVANPFTADQIANFKRQHRLNLSDGQICQFDFYYMERHGWGANMRIVTNMHITDPSLAIDKQAYQYGEEIEYGGVIDPTSSVEYNFTLTNTGNTKLYNLTWTDEVLGLTMDPTNGLTVKSDMNGIYVMNASGGYLQPKDMTAIVTGLDANGNYGEFTVTFDEVNGDGGQESFKRFLKKLESNDGTSSGFDDAEVTNAGSGLWVGGSVRFKGIYYMLTPEQTKAGMVDNTVYLTATTRVDPTSVGNRTLRSDASHRLYINGFPIHYQWAGHNIFMNLEHLLGEAKKEAERAGSQLSLYQQFFKNVTLSNLYTQPCDKFGRVGGDYSSFLTAYTDDAGHSGYLINYDEPGIYTFYLLMYMKSGKDNLGNNKTFAASGVNASQIGEGYYAILRSQVFVADVKDSVYVLDYGLTTESLDANGALFQDDYLFGPYGTIRAKLMGVTGSAPSFIDPAKNADATKTGISFAAQNLLQADKISTPNGYYNVNLSIPSTGKDIAYNSNTGEYTLTGVGTMTIKANLPTDGNWDMPYLYYWYDDGTAGPAWPGTPMKKDSAGKYELDIPADVTNVIINNGSAALKTNDLKITPGLESTITVAVHNGNYVEAIIDTIMEKVTIHVKAPSSWGQVYLNHWNENGEIQVFPGDLMTEKDANGYWTFEVPGDVNCLVISDGSTNLTRELTIYAGKEVWVDVAEESNSSMEREDGSVFYYYGTSVKYTLSEGYVVHASTPASWKDAAYLYYWRTDGSENAPWPGVAMTKDETGWYTYGSLVPADVTQLIINDGADGGNHQTVNITVTPGLETWVTVQNETSSEGDNKGKYLAKVAYGSEAGTTGLTFTPNTFLDQENNMWLAITVHGTNSNHSALNSNINIHNEVQMYKKITVLPATVVYYEDTFNAIQYHKDDTTTGNSFVHHGKGSGLLSQSIDQSQNYGQDATYQDSVNDLYSGGSLTAVQIVDQAKFATFTFKGTGFELVGRTNAATAGSFMARVYKKANYTTAAYDEYLAAATAYVDDIAKYNIVTKAYTDATTARDDVMAAREDVFTKYYAAVDAYAAAKDIYETDPEAAEVQAYWDAMDDLYRVYAIYVRKTEVYQSKLDAYAKAMSNHLGNGQTVVTGGVAGKAEYETSTEFVDPDLLAMSAYESVAPNDPETAAGIVKPVEPTAPFVTVAAVFTQFDHGNDGGAEAINQVPVLRIANMDMDEYVVELAGMPIYTFDPNNNYEISGVADSYVFIDGLRIFQPMGATNDNYLPTENGAQISELRDLIAEGKIAVGVLEAGKLVISSGTSTWTEGFFDNDFDPETNESFENINVGSADDYIIQGPNNEVYMEGNITTSAIVLYVQETDSNAHDIQIAVRALDYDKYYGSGTSALSAQLQYGILLNDGSYAWKNLVRVASGTEQYYSIPYSECPVDTQGRYQIVLRAINPQTGANAMVSYSNVKLNGLEIVKVDGVGDGSMIFYENGMLIKPSFELVVINAQFEEQYTIPFNGNELTIPMVDEWLYVYVRATTATGVYNFNAKSDPGPVDTAIMYRVDENFNSNRWPLDVERLGADEITFNIRTLSYTSLELSYCKHTYGEGVQTREPNCTLPGIIAYTCTKCGHVKRVETETNDKHTYSEGLCVYCNSAEPKFYLIGYINGKNHGCEQNYEQMGDYLFVDGKLQVNFEKDSYVYLKSEGNQAWYMVPAYVTEDTATFYDTTLGGYTEKMYVPCGVDLILTLTVNDDGSLTLHYEEPCKHSWDSVVVNKKPTCTADGEQTFTCSKCYSTKKEMVPATGHNYVNGVCANSGCGDIEYRTIYFKNTNNWTDVYMYAWVENGESFTNAWPGDSMNPVEGENGIYSMTIPAYLKVIFNDGGSVQTDDMVLPEDGRDMYVFSDNIWVNHSGEVDYYLVGSINGVDYGFGDNANNMGIYKFVDGKLTVSFQKESYVFLKTTGNADWFMCDTYCDTYNATMYNTDTGANEKMFIPGGTEIEFTLTVNDDGTVDLVAHSWGGVVTKQPTCTEPGEMTYICYLCNDSYKEPVAATGHNFVDDVCTVCGVVDTVIVYFKNTAGWEDVYIWGWHEGGENYTGGTWPGMEMSLVEGETDLYYFVLSAKADSVIFSTSSGVQTDNLHAPVGDKNKYTYGADKWSTLDEEVELPDIEYLYLQPGDWAVDNAWFAAYFYNNGETWIKMTDSDGDGIYQCVLPDGYPNVIFCRMSKDMTDLSWDAKWNQTVDLTMPTDGGNFFTITNPWDGPDGKAEGTWSTYVCAHTYTEKVTVSPTCDTAGEKTFTCTKCGDSYTEAVAPTGHSYSEGSCTVCGSRDPDYVTYVYLKPGADWMQAGAWFAAWFPGAETWVTMTDNFGNGYYTAAIPQGATGVVFVRMNPEASEPSFDQKWNQTVDLQVEENRLYVIENPWNEAFEWKATGSWTEYDASVAECAHDYQKLVIVAVGCLTAGENRMTCSKCADSYTEPVAATGHNFVNGTCSHCGEAEPTEPVILYLKPSSNWNESGARFAAYFFGNGETWVSMTSVGNGIYMCEAPQGYPSVIFCRMDPNNGANNWDNKWNQTGNLVVPSGSNTLCTIPDGNWNPGAGDVSWSTYTATYSTRRFTLPSMYIGGDEEYVLNLSSINSQLNSDVVFGELDLFVPGETEPETGDVVINSAAPVLSDDISMNYYVTVPENAENVYMTFGFGDKITLVTDYTVADNGRYRFTFKGINAQRMGDNIRATLYATVNGVEISDCIEEYSVRTYCINALAKNPGQTVTTMISDLLVYGEKAQIYTGYNTDALVTEGLDLTPSTFTALDESYDKMSVTGTADANVRYSAATLMLSNKVNLRLTVRTSDPFAYTYTVNANGEDTVYTGEDLVKVSDGVYYLYFDQLKATGFDSVVTATIQKDGQTISQTVTYSVNTYIYRNQNTEDTAMRELLEAIFNYGRSAAAMVN